MKQKETSNSRGQSRLIEKSLKSIGASSDGGFHSINRCPSFGSNLGAADSALLKETATELWVPFSCILSGFLLLQRWLIVLSTLLIFHLTALHLQRGALAFPGCVHNCILLLSRNVLRMLHISMMLKTQGHLWETFQDFVSTIALSFISVAALPSACSPAISTFKNAVRPIRLASATSFACMTRTIASPTCWGTRPSTATWAQWWRTAEAASSSALPRLPMAWGTRSSCCMPTTRPTVCL